ncbi:DNA polymerase/3'-5' exonuclease PolX [Bryobacterales bacterium F-183]|nr:DNA polymerase/3'-5' exonuclease PolX [Bryobacterales bacterium F-183]
MQNREVARILSETADLMEIAAEDGFRIRSYRNAASAIESCPDSVMAMLGSEDRKVTDVPGIGKGIAAVLEELAKRGSFEKRDKLLEKYPPTALELLKIQGLGPKSVALLFEHLRITTVDDLERACKEHRLAELPRMGTKLEEKVLRSIAAYRNSAGRFLISFAQQTADTLSTYLLELPGVERVQFAGSLRRGKETVGDLDLLATGPGAEQTLEHFTKHPRVNEVLARGGNKASIRFGLEGLQVDLRTLPASSYGAAMQYFTGSKEHNVTLRQRALKLGLTLNEYGLSKLDGGEIVASETEQEIYGKLGLAWIPPELRENSGEIEAAEAGSLPALLEIGDMRGDLHMHTRETDGRATLEEMAELAREAGYEYIAITDHSKALAMANGLDEVRVVAFAERVRRLNEDGGLGIHIFSGIECDIMRDGRMDLDDSALAELDFVIGSVHNNMNLESAEMTDRLLGAISNPNVDAIGHPTGRILMHRESYPFDFERIAAACADRGVWLEVNASPERLDIHGPLLRAAKAKGVKFVISTDAHHPKHLGNMRYGVVTARRGWLTKADVMNTLPLPELRGMLAKRQKPA